MSPSHSRFIHQCSLVAAETPSSEAESSQYMSLNLAAPQRSLTSPKILRYGVERFTFPPKEGVLRKFKSLKNSYHSIGFKPANLGPNGKQHSGLDSKLFTRQNIAIKLESNYIFESLSHSIKLILIDVSNASENLLPRHISGPTAFTIRTAATFVVFMKRI
jgi:hypothetical protein